MWEADKPLTGIYGLHSNAMEDRRYGFFQGYFPGFTYGQCSWTPYVAFKPALVVLTVAFSFHTYMQHLNNSSLSGPYVGG